MKTKFRYPLRKGNILLAIALALMPVTVYYYFKHHVHTITKYDIEYYSLSADTFIYPIEISFGSKPKLSDIQITQIESGTLGNDYKYTVNLEINLKNISDEPVNLSIASAIKLSAGDWKFSNYYSGINIQSGELRTITTLIELGTQNHFEFWKKRHNIVFAEDEGWLDYRIGRIDPNPARKSIMKQRCRWKPVKVKCYDFFMDCDQKDINSLSDDCDKSLLKGKASIVRTENESTVSEEIVDTTEIISDVFLYKAIVKTKSTGVNLRSGPEIPYKNPRGNIILKIPQNTVVFVYEEGYETQTINDKENRWYMVGFADENGKEVRGYLWGEYLKRID